MAQGDTLGVVMQSDIGSTASGGVAHQAVEASLAAEFDASASYAVGEYCTKNGVLYRCTTAHTGAWDANHFTAVSVGDDIVNYLPMLFAPAGFGLGGFGKALTSNDDVHNVTNGGVYHWTSTSVPSNVPVNTGIMLCISRSQNNALHIISDASSTAKPQIFFEKKFDNWKGYYKIDPNSIIAVT